MPDEVTSVSTERIAVFQRKAAEARKQAKSAAAADIRANYILIAESYDRLAASVADLAKHQK